MMPPITGMALESHRSVPHDEHGPQVFLQAGRELLAHAASEVALRALTVRSVTRRAGRSTGAFYHYWDTQADFTRELMSTLFDPDDARDNPQMHAVAEALGGEATCDQLAELFFLLCDFHVRSDAARQHTIAWSAPAGSPEWAGMGAVYRGYDQALGALLSDAFGDRVLTGDITYEQLAAMLIAACEGLGTRRRIDPDVSDRPLVRHMVIGLLDAFVCGDDVRRIDQAMARVDRALAQGRQARRTS